MAIHNEGIEERSSGFDKGIEASAVNLILDNLQRFQYQFPIKSTVREIACNGIDSIADKNAALDILLNNAPVSKYYVEMPGDLYKDSGFDRDYYDPKWLGTDDEVKIVYHVGQNQEKDKIVISDSGVGLGKNRLRGYFNLGYSTKRLSKLPLGKFGIGAKSPLSVGVDFYTTESRYNGYRYKFNIYSHGVDSIIPKFDLEKGTENRCENWGTAEKPYLVYSEPTEELNGVTVTIEAKKHHKQQYIDAVKSQMLYFQNIEFGIQEGHQYTKERYRATIFYEDDYIVLSDNSIWSKPHLLLNKVNYGFINYEELELENKSGNIGIKVNPEDIEVNPSRESIIWSDKTKEKVLQRYQDVVKIASGFIQKELKETDFIKWIRICANLSSSAFRSSASSSVVARLAPIINLEEVQLHYPGNDAIRFSHGMLRAFQVREYKMETSRRKNAEVAKVMRTDTGIMAYNCELPIILMDTKVSVRKDKYLLKKVYTQGFIGISAPDWLDENFGPDTVATGELLVRLGINDWDKAVEWTPRLRTAVPIWEALNKSADALFYSKFIVPDDFNANDDSDEEEVEVVTEKEREVIEGSIAERRKAQGKTLVQTPVKTYYHEYSSTINKGFYMDRYEIPVAEINEWDNPEIYYGNDEDIEMFHFAAFLTRSSCNDYTSASDRPRNNWDNDDVRLVKVARGNNRLYRDFKHIQQFFIDIKNSKIIMSNRLVQWNTARLIRKQMHKLNFLWNYAKFDQEKASEYRKLVDYVAKYYNEVEEHTNKNMFGVNSATYDSLISHLDKVQVFQDYVATKPDPVQLAEVAKDLFGNSTINDGLSVDPEMWALFNSLLEYAQPIGDMLNSMFVLTSLNGMDSETEDMVKEDYDQFIERGTPPIYEQVEHRIREYLQWKNVPC